MQPRAPRLSPKCPAWHGGLDASPAGRARHAPHRRAAPRKAAPLFTGQEARMPQISPALRSTRALSLDTADCPACARRWPPRRRPSLADALLTPPTPETAPLLRELGLPAIPGVPPIVILNPGPAKRAIPSEALP